MSSKPARKLYIVEDEPTISSLLSLALAKLGYNVVGASDNGPDAIRQVAELMPDLVLMDVQLNGAMDGTEAARQIRVTSGRPVIFLTGHSDAGVVQRAKETEPYGYILKPFSSRELMVQVEMALYRHQMENERAQLKRELEIAHENLRTLRGLLPLCAGCKKIREDDGYWSKLEDYFALHANVEFTHGFCPECEDRFYGTRAGHRPAPLVIERKKNPRR
ncbi:MAG TPA: response regulator [Opitutaceae bacterium]|nr:response regulator [Opitutaceae bacterium]